MQLKHIIFALSIGLNIILCSKFLLNFNYDGLDSDRRFFPFSCQKKCCTYFTLFYHLLQLLSALLSHLPVASTAVRSKVICLFDLILYVP